MTLRTRRAAALTAGAMLLSLAACSREGEAPAADAATDNASVENSLSPDAALAGNDVAASAQTFTLADAAGKSLGSVAVSEGSDGLTFSVTASGMAAGSHGLHLHEKGLCEGPKFESAGKHWNPAAKQHGRDNPAGAHLGDLANLDVAGAGTATAGFTVAGTKMASGATMLADADGTSLVMHAKPDDYKTDPSGDSGDRIACAVIAPPK
jgi:Cu-Zn family superoxide dismutase